jgi:trimeric autotransporter adhesin
MNPRVAPCAGRRDCKSSRAKVLVSLVILAALLPPRAQAEWSAGFHPPGWIDGRINAEVVYHGDLVVAGSFRYVGGLAVNGIARWDGSRWHPFGDGFDGTIQALLVTGDTLVAAGSFNHSGSAEANSIARWDGSVWNPMGAGIRGRVNCLAAANGRIVAGGYFQEAGGVPAQNSAVWNGTEWRPIIDAGYSDARNYEITSLAAMGDTIVAILYFACQGVPYDPDELCGVIVRIVAGDGTGWDFDIGASGDVTPDGIWFLDGTLYATGHYDVFTPPGDFRFGFGVFRWTGHTWAKVGEDFDSHTWSQVLALYQGRPTLALSYGVFQWDGTTWQKLLSVHSDEIKALVDYAGQLVIGGRFEWDDPFRRCLAGWDGSAWHAFGDPSGEGVNGTVRGMAQTSEGLFVAGGIDHVGHARAGGWAGWKDGGWIIPPVGVAGEAHPLASYHDRLYAVGAITPDCIRYCSGLARWDGSAWTEVPGLPGGIASLAEHQGRLIAGGTFVTPQAPGRHVAAYDGVSWAPLGEGLPNTVAALLSYQDSLYAAGWGADYGGPPGGVSRWTGSDWSPMGDTLGWGATALAGYANGIVAGGKTEFLDGYPWRAQYSYSCNRWDGVSWRPMAGAPDGPVTSFAVFHGDLVAAGGFHKIGETSAPGLARWNGTSWSALGGGLDDAAHTLLVQGDSLWVGGQFQHAGGIPSSGIAVWVEPRPSISQLRATCADRTVTVSWVLPSDPGVRGAVVRGGIGGFPVDPRDGDPIPGGSGDGVFPGSPGEHAEMHQTVLPDGRLRCYTAFAYTDPTSYSRPAYASARPADLTGPVVTMDLSRDPDSSSVLAVRLAASEPLDSSRISLRAGQRRLSLAAADRTGRRWISNLDLAPEQGTIALDAVAADSAGNRGEVSAEFFASRIQAADGGAVESADGRLRLAVYPSALRTDRILTVVRTDSAATGVWPEYLIQPASGLAVPGMIVLGYGDALSPGDDPFRLQVLQDDRPLLSYVDTSARTVTAAVDHLGRFRLNRNPAAVSSRADPSYLRVDRPWPNPFQDGTQIRLEIRAAQRVRVVICGVDGRVTRHLLDASLPLGETRIRWDGATDQGRPAATGLYWCRIAGEHSDGTVRLVRLR